MEVIPAAVDIQKEFFPHPLAPLLQPLGMEGKDDGPEGSVLPLESPFIFGEKPVELIKQHPIERLFPFLLHFLK